MGARLAGYCRGQEVAVGRPRTHGEGRSFRRKTRCGVRPEGPELLGLCEMIGNVWEWTLDWYGQKYYETSPDRNPKGPPEGRYRQNERSETIGFRCVKDATGR
jgi:formylglycine-generating enzyme required for sulfatase activity